MRLAYLALTIAAVAMVGACGSGSTKQSSPSGPNPNATESNIAGDIPDNQAFVPYVGPGASFTVSVPEGWAYTKPGSDALFTDKYNSVTIRSRPVATAPTVATAQSSEMSTIRADAKNFRAGKVSAISRKAGQAVLITYQADSPPNSVTGKVAREAVERYEFWRAGQEVALTLAAPLGSDNVDPWRTITDSFRWSK
jgi:hypothetical protein